MPSNLGHRQPLAIQIPAPAKAAARPLGKFIRLPRKILASFTR
jgi:hypothetical protein